MKKLKQDYLKSATCHLKVETLTREGKSYKALGDLEHLFDMEFPIEFQHSLPVAAYTHWSRQIHQQLVNQLESLPHIGMIDKEFTNNSGVDEDDKWIAWLLCPIEIHEKKYFDFYGIVATYTFSNRVYVGDEKKAFVI